MSIRLNCQSCKTAFVTSDDMLGRSIACPKCGAEQTVPTAVLADSSAPPASDASVFVPRDEVRRPGRGRKIALAALGLVVVAAVAGVVTWPMIRARLWPAPTDPVEITATAYLRALSEGNTEEVRRLGTVDEPPAIRSFRKVHRDPARDRRIKGSFAPIAALHARINETYEYDPTIGRFTPRNPLGPAAETLDALHDAKAKSEQDEIARKIASGNPEDIFDAAESLGKTFTRLAEGALAPKKLIPTYKHLVQDAKPPLPPEDQELALDFADNRETWDALLKRPFPTLKADGPFILDRAEVTATAIDRLASSGDPPTPLYLTLTRFQFEGIDTGWKVTSARRQPSLPVPSEPAPSAPDHSPGDSGP